MKFKRLAVELLRFIATFVQSATFRQYVRQAPAFAQALKWSEKSEAGVLAPGGKSVNSAGELQRFFDDRKQGRGIQKWQHYFSAYEKHLGKFVGKQLAFAEIGIFSGGSLEMWQEYFGTGCAVCGIDIAPETKIFENERTRIFIGDQGDSAFWERFKREVPALDVLIDDGSHIPAHQISTFEEIFPRLNPGGVYICEDVHGEFNAFTAYIYGLSDRLNNYHALPMGSGFAEGVESGATLLQSMISSIHVYPFMVVIEKTEVPIQKFEAPRHGTEWQPFYK